jgi:hypothetical protein
MQADILAFDRELRDFARGIALRPFLCDGSPFGCDVFLVGINPATDVPLWPYWSIERGCDKCEWLQAYGETHHGRLGRTRKFIERLCDALAPVRALETNVFHHHSSCEADLIVQKRTTEVFDFLLRRLKPRVVFVYGKSAVKHLRRLTNAEIERGVFERAHYQGITFDVLAGNHLSRQWSYAGVEAFGRELRDHCLSIGETESGVARLPRTTLG